MHKEIAELLKKSAKTVVLTGAGVSTNSGLKDYRSSIDNDKYKGTKLSELCNINNKMDEVSFISYYRAISKEIKSKQPNEAHTIIESWKNKGIINNILTQNIDGYHGKDNVIELHGNLDTFYCKQCGKKYSWKYYQNTHKCNKMDFTLEKGYITCNGILRPNTVLFGEYPRHIEKSLYHIYSSDVMLILGTSLSVSPVNLLPLMGKKIGITLIAINKTPIQSIGEYIDYAIYGEDIIDELAKIDIYI